MARPITLRNINSQLDVGGLSRGFSGASQAFDKSASGIQNLFGGIADEQADERSILANEFINSLTSDEALSGADLSNAALRQRFGGRLNEDVAANALGQQQENRDKLMANQEFTDYQTGQTNKAILDPLRARFSGLTTYGDITSGLAEEDLLKGVGGKAASDFITNQQKRAIDFRGANREEKAAVKKIKDAADYETGQEVIGQILSGNPDIGDTASLLTSLRTVFSGAENQDGTTTGEFSEPTKRALEQELIKRRDATYDPNSNLSFAEQQKLNALTRSTQQGIVHQKEEADDVISMNSQLDKLPKVQLFDSVESIMNSELTPSGAVDSYVDRVNSGASDAFKPSFLWDSDTDEATGDDAINLLKKAGNRKYKDKSGKHVGVPGAIMEQALRDLTVDKNFMLADSINVDKVNTKIDELMRDYFKAVENADKSAEIKKKFNEKKKNRDLLLLKKAGVNYYNSVK